MIVGAPANAYATEDRQRFALRLLRRGALPVAVCNDRAYPSPRGSVVVLNKRVRTNP